MRYGWAIFCKWDVGDDLDENLIYICIRNDKAFQMKNDSEWNSVNRVSNSRDYYDFHRNVHVN